MMDLVCHIILSLTSAMKVCVTLMILSRLTTSPKVKAISPFICGAGAAFFLRMIASFLPISAVTISAMEIACILPFAVILWKKDFRLSLFLAIFSEIALWLWEVLATHGLASLMKDPTYLTQETLKCNIASGLPALIALLGMLLVPLRWPECHKNAYRIFTVLLIMTMFAVISLPNLEPYHPADETYNLCIYLSALLLLSLLIYRLRNQYEMEHELAELKDQQAEMVSREYNTLQNAYSMNARLFHDFRNHLGALRSLMQSQQYEDAMQYIDDLAGPDTLHHGHWTGDDTIDYLIGSKEQLAKEHDIKFTAEVEFPKNTQLRSADLCSILGNLLDNAIEGAQKIPDINGRFIRLTIRRINHMIMIRVENSFEKPPVTEGGSLRTTKTDGGLHGWGVKSARTAAEKYDGALQTSFEGNIFRAVVTLSLPVKP
ncbi:MAG: sensor histidine kinase [Lachnospiraceae bacterium]|nr:sensor histidine kinase [Lachnospiraceae bacterium]